MKRMATIARREYLERVRSKAFLVSTFLGPILVAGFMLAPSILMERQRLKDLREIKKSVPRRRSFVSNWRVEP